jgi:hypothetical protein
MAMQKSQQENTFLPNNHKPQPPRKMNSRKTTKTELQNAVDSFRYRMSWVTGGTKDEILRQAPVAVIELEEMAKKVAELLCNLSKPALRNEHLCDYASRIPSMLAEYRRRFLAA